MINSEFITQQSLPWKHQVIPLSNYSVTRLGTILFDTELVLDSLLSAYVSFRFVSFRFVSFRFVAWGIINIIHSI